jgi:replication factor C small subunit|tara:strand:- start:2546 stop:3466 length:921 start_codon:yes stop_codon:yes gene_type:complete
MKMLWTEKYRPKRIADVVGQYNFTIDAEGWIQNKEQMPNLLLYGVAGVGKTAAGIALANDILQEDVDNNFFEINASDDRRLETVRNQIKDIASTKRIGDAPFKIILLDEMDGMTKDAQNALKRIMERYAENCRFIITCNDRHRIIHPLQSRCANYGFHRLKPQTMHILMTKILENEEVTHIDSDELETFIDSLHGDMRRGLTELQAAIYGKSSLLNQIDKNLEPYTEIMQMIDDNRYEDSLGKVHDLLYNSVDMDTICVNLHDVIIKTDMQSAKKFKMLRVVGEAQWRSSNMTPKLLASWMIGQLM